MNEEQLASKSLDDLKAIAVTFQLFTNETIENKSREEIIAAITGQPAKAPVSEKKTTKKPAAKKTTKKSTKTEETAEVKEEKATKKPAKKTAAKKNTEEVKETASEAEPEVKETKKKTVRKTTKKAKTETSDEVKVEAEAASVETPAEVKTESSAESSIEPIKAEDKAASEEEKKPAKRSRAKKTSKVQTEEVKTETEVTAEPSVKAEVPQEAKAEDKAEDKADATKKTKRSRSKKKSSDTASEATPSEETSEAAATEETTKEQQEPSKEEAAEPKKSKRNKKRRISFGPSQEAKEVEIPEGEAQAEASEETPAPVVPEIVYTEIEGVLSIGGDRNDFCGFVHKTNYLPGEEDAYVSGQLIKRLGLRKGDYIKGLVTAPGRKEKYAPLKKVISVNDIEVPEDLTDWDVLRKRPRFEQLTAVYPDDRLTLETSSEDLSCRIIDLFCPIGKGQRGMIVSPPKAGKTILMQKVANAITTNHPEAKVMVLLIDERPEEVTDMQRHIKGEVAYSTFDKRPENHVRLTELVLERAMRLVELGQDVIILLDSMTRLGRAYNLTVTPSGRTLSGGLDPASLYGPKRFFGAARNIEGGGSLTIIATALIETGSKMDEVIFEEFKGTGNMEVVLDRKLADRRVYPAIAVEKSGTRREDLLLSVEEMESVWLTRKAIAEVDTIAATEAVINFMKKTASNRSFVLSAKKSFDVD